jgi:hypothetical protein
LGSGQEISPLSRGKVDAALKRDCLGLSAYVIHSVWQLLGGEEEKSLTNRICDSILIWLRKIYDFGGTSWM